MQVYIFFVLFLQYSTKSLKVQVVSQKRTYENFKVVSNSNLIKKSIAIHANKKSPFHRKSSTLFNAIEGIEEASSSDTSKQLTDFGKLTFRCSWFTWWIQIILTVVSGVILTFANTVRGQEGFRFWTSGFAFSVIGIALSFLNCFWTWTITRVCQRIFDKRIEDAKILPTFKKYFQYSVFISLVGLFATIIGAEQVVGTLASKALNSQAGGFTPMIITSGSQVNALANSVQALDIFLVQANTNIFASYFAPLACYLWLMTQFPDQRKRSLFPQRPPRPKPAPIAAQA